MTIRPLPDPQRQASREEHKARRSRDIVDLLDRRAELRGVHAMADFIVDGIRWSA